MKSRRTEQPAEDTKSQSNWMKTPIANLVRYKPSGIYFACLRIRGKLLQTSLKDPFRVQNKHGFNSWKLGASERQGR